MSSPPNVLPVKFSGNIAVRQRKAFGIDVKHQVEESIAVGVLDRGQRLAIALYPDGSVGQFNG